MVQSLIYSFYNYDGLQQMIFIGFKNYKMIFGYDWHDMRLVLKSTFLFAVISVPLNLFLSYLLAMLLNNKIKGVKVYRLIIYLPVIIPSIISSFLWRDIYNPTFGVMNRIFAFFGLPQSQFIYSGKTAMASLIFANMWGLGGGMVLWLAALKNVPETLYESAKIDGAGWFTRTFKITVPMSTPMIFYNLVMGIIASLQVFNVFVMAGDQATSSLYFFAYKIYLSAFHNYMFGYASALAWFLFLIIAVLTAVVFKTQKWVYYAEDM